MTITIEFWIAFNAIVLLILFIDLKFMQAKAHAVSIKESVLWTFFCVFLALLFNVGIYYFMGKEKALQFLTGYVIEESLSVDNLFVFLMIFKYFSVPAQYQPTVLRWGIIGAIVMRFIMIFAGVKLLNTFHWMIYVFGAILLYTGFKMAFEEEKKIEPEKNPVLKIFKKIMPVAMQGYTSDKFFVRLNGVLHATPLFIVLLIVETTDLVFAVDSIPAILAITTDTFIVYTSNVFAILGLRALFFLLSGILPYFTFLKFGISIILCWVGIKMMIVHWYKIPTMVSLGVVIALLAGSILVSIIHKRWTERATPKSL